MTTHFRTQAREIVSAFKGCINWRDIDGMADLMAEQHVHEDATGSIVVGRLACLEAWVTFFQSFPDYRTHFDRIFVQRDRVVALGHATCSDVRMAGTAIWVAELRDGTVHRWRAYADSPSIRGHYGIP